MSRPACGKIPMRHSEGVRRTGLRPGIHHRSHERQFVVIRQTAPIPFVGPILGAKRGVLGVGVLLSGLAAGSVAQVEICISTGRRCAPVVATRSFIPHIRIGERGICHAIAAGSISRGGIDYGRIRGDEVIPVPVDGLKHTHERPVHSAIVCLPIQNRRVIAVVNHHVAMKLFLQK